ncbi:hypothetical protein Ptr902_13286 [Pyrenophora tritici-repentis]|nr:hypothetical protein Ptr902_13286 [Pyrenophora tritici-repentis]
MKLSFAIIATTLALLPGSNAQTPLPGVPHDICGECDEVGPKLIRYWCPISERVEQTCWTTCSATNVQKKDILCCVRIITSKA